jgi:hypothetical protein
MNSVWEQSFLDALAREDKQTRYEIKAAVRKFVIDKVIEHSDVETINSRIMDLPTYPATR